MLAVKWRKDSRGIKKKAERTIRRLGMFPARKGILDQGDRSVSDEKLILDFIRI